MIKDLSAQKCCGQEGTSLSQKGQVQQPSTPRAEDGRALPLKCTTSASLSRRRGQGQVGVGTVNMPGKKVQHVQKYW